METEVPTLPEMLLAERKKRKLTRTAVAAEFGISEPMLYMIESGQRGITPAFSLKIGQWLGLGDKVGAVLAGYMPWMATVEQAQKVVDIFNS